jgi:alternate signal-mediated exported protein
MYNTHNTHKRKGIRLKQALDKWTALAFAIAWAFLAVIGSTFSWITTTDSRVNVFRGEARFGTSITEVFTPNFAWRPGTTAAKEVRVINTEKVPAFVRLHGAELLKIYETDPVTGNATSVVRAEIEYSTIALSLENRPPELDDFITIQGDKVLVAPDGSQSNYWLYDEDGWYYYSEPLLPGEITEAVMTSLSLSAAVPNYLKNADYTFTVTLDAVQAQKGALSEWGITSGDVYDLLNPKGGN